MIRIGAEEIEEEEGILDVVGGSKEFFCLVPRRAERAERLMETRVGVEAGVGVIDPIYFYVAVWAVACCLSMVMIHMSSLSSRDGRALSSPPHPPTATKNKCFLRGCLVLLDTVP